MRLLIFLASALGLFDSSVSICTDEYLLSTQLLNKNPTHPTSASSFHEFWAKDIDGEDVKMSKYKGKVVVVVNTASQWGYTPQNYAQLGSLQKNYAKQGFVVVVFPSNSFNQEPLNNKQIKEYNNNNEGKNFDIYEKIAVKGDCEHPLYKFLVAKQGGYDITWNYNKFLIDVNGNVVKRYGSPKSESIEGDIKEQLEKVKEKKEIGRIFDFFSDFSTN